MTIIYHSYIEHDTRTIELKIYKSKSSFLISDWSLFCLARILQPNVGYSSSFWISCVSLWSIDCLEFQHKLCRVSWDDTSYFILVHYIYFFLHSGEVCDKNSETGKKIICPECPQYCPFKQLSESCHLYNVSYLFDNDFTVLFALFMSLWGEWCVV